MRAGGLGFRDRPVAADCCYTLGGMLQVEVNYADAYPRQIPPEAGDMLQKLPLSLASATAYPMSSNHAERSRPMSSCSLRMSSL